MIVSVQEFHVCNKVSRYTEDDAISKIGHSEDIEIAGIDLSDLWLQYRSQNRTNLFTTLQSARESFYRILFLETSFFSS